MISSHTIPSPHPRLALAASAAGLACIFAAATPASAAATSKLPPAAAAFDFGRDIQPILEGACVKCHGAAKQKGKFRLDTVAGLMKGGENGKAVRPGQSADSPLIQYVARLVEDMEMPPDKDAALSPAQIALLRAWVDAGAVYPEGTTLVARGPAPATVVGTAVRAAAAPVVLPPAATGHVDFVTDVQPLFVQACYGCHGPKKQEAAFRLDHKATVMRGGELGPAIVRGKSADSLLIQLVAGMRGDTIMPARGPRLTAAQIGILRAWIDQGADFPDAASVVLKDRRDHWAFKAPVKPAPPAVKTAAWARTPVDNFVLARLEHEGLAPSPEADKITLLRRLQFDLIGLPPTIAEVETFLADTSPRAYEKQVERLLASPHYGERWGRHWLDAARYADSDGFEKDKSRNVWFYRDWVVNAFNQDLPYDQFVIDQIAGDQLPRPTQEQVVATGFLRNSMVNEEGGVDPEQFRMDAMFDRMDAIGKSVLGLTIQCAQCHSHKYDPISQEEYYRLFAFLNNDHEPTRAVYTSDEQVRRADVLRRIAEKEAALRRAAPDWKARMARWEDQHKGGQPTWVTLQAPFIDDTTGGQKYLPQKDGSYLAGGYAPTKHTGKVVVKTDLTVINAFQVELLTDPNLPLNGPGRSIKGTCALTEFEVEAAPADAPDKKQKIKFKQATADYEQPEAELEATFYDKTDKKRVVGPARFAIDGKEETAWGIDAGPGRRNVERKIVFVPEAPIANAGGTVLTIGLKQSHGGWNSDDNMTNNLGRFRLSITATAGVAADPIPKRVRDLFAIPHARRTAAQVDEMFQHFRTTVPAWKAANAEIEALWKQHPAGSTSLVLAARDEARDTHMLKRGDFLKPGKSVTPGVPEILHQLPPGAPPTRLTFARWLVDRRSPTTARVFVNRVWQAYFGTGIVSTSEDLGTQSESPSHPELLDWLATEFMDHGWRVKDLQRQIVMSATYRQQSRVTPEAYTRDQYNRLLARGPRVRVEGEIVRDMFLSASGLLNPKVGGRAVMPPAPAFLFMPPVSYGPFAWVDETGPDRYRRALYTFRRQSTPYPLLQTFDVPNADTSCVRRTKSNTPLQALMTLNETVSMESAQALARRMLEMGVADANDRDRQRVTLGFRRVLSRTPTATEQQELLSLLERQKKRIADGWTDAWQLATGGSQRPDKLPPGTTPAELAAYTVVGRVLLNLDEAITKE